MEEHRNQATRDEFLKNFWDVQSDVKRLKEHEALDRPKYEKYFGDIWTRLNDLEKMRLEDTNGRLRTLENRPIVIQLTKDEIRTLFDEWGRAWGDALAGRLSFKFILWVAGTVSTILTALIIAAIAAYFHFRQGGI